LIEKENHLHHNVDLLLLLNQDKHRYHVLFEYDSHRRAMMLNPWVDDLWLVNIQIYLNRNQSWVYMDHELVLLLATLEIYVEKVQLKDLYL
jgi:hypothetical protein